MNNFDRALLRTYKSYYKAYLESDEIIAKLYIKRKKLQHMMTSVNSPNFDGIRYAPTKTRDMRLAEYATKVESIDKQIETLRREQDRIDGINKYIPTNLVAHIHSVYNGSHTFADVGNAIGYSECQTRRLIDKEIIKAMHKYMDQ